MKLCASNEYNINNEIRPQMPSDNFIVKLKINFFPGKPLLVLTSKKYTKRQKKVKLRKCHIHSATKLKTKLLKILGTTAIQVAKLIYDNDNKKTGERIKKDLKVQLSASGV